MLKDKEFIWHYLGLPTNLNVLNTFVAWCHYSPETATVVGDGKNVDKGTFLGKYAVSIRLKIICADQYKEYT